ncbi:MULTISPECIES: acyltransferase [Ramlibacter]|uniref:Acyltransferase n=1 Tax=Ramlibacter aquaticus TaxID=2780094 RepID=A0ABR9SEM6_9BURK|nr:MULTISPECIES: acyltransferase [Ramlibacter]MBE7940798.1 acyltransferase [Ramlibacter aquaticus]
MSSAQPMARRRVAAAPRAQRARRGRGAAQVSGAGRVLGWDLLRGLCALMVAIYHLLYWLGLAELQALGTYGVYLFFVLSGASLAYSYGDLGPAPGGVLRFLAVRWMRLAPLFLAVTAVFLAMLYARDGRLVDGMPLRLALNASLLFGFHDPVVWSLPVGGWSLGIEFVFYLAFPLLMLAVRRPAWASAACIALLVLQAAWLQATVGTDGWEDSAVRYHQVPAFAGYFFVGCLIGHARRARTLAWPFAAGLVAWATLGLLLAGAMGEPGQELLGTRGLVLVPACFAVVWASGQVRVPGGRLSRVAAWLGDVTYGTYLIHPLLVFSLMWFVLPRFTPRAVESLATPLRGALLLVLLAATCTLAWASERWFERPLRQTGRRLLGGGPASAQA